jgi:hypothetical protein
VRTTAKKGKMAASFAKDAREAWGRIYGDGRGGGGIWGWKEAAEESPIFFPRVSQLCL